MSDFEQKTLENAQILDSEPDSAQNRPPARPYNGNTSQSPHSKLLPTSQARSAGPPRTRAQIDHSKRPHHDSLGRELAPWKPEDDIGPTDEAGKPICGARLAPSNPNKHGDGKCHGRPMANGRCRIHGGASPLGPASPHYKHGKYSRFLPARLADTYLEGLHDPNRLSMENQIAVLDARIAELMGRLDVNATEDTFKTAVALMDDMYNASRIGDTRTATQKMLQLRAVLKEGSGDFSTWAAIMRTMEAQRRLSETEQKRLVLAQQTLTADQAMQFLNQVITIIRDYVPDPLTQSAIARKLIELSGPAGGAEA